MAMNKITSVTFHTTGEGQRLSYTYSVIDEHTGTVISDNNRKSIVVVDMESNNNILDCISQIHSYVLDKLEN